MHFLSSNTLEISHLASIYMGWKVKQPNLVRKHICFPWSSKWPLCIHLLAPILGKLTGEGKGFCFWPTLSSYSYHPRSGIFFDCTLRMNFKSWYCTSKAWSMPCSPVANYICCHWEEQGVPNAVRMRSQPCLKCAGFPSSPREETQKRLKPTSLSLTIIWIWL